MTLSARSTARRRSVLRRHVQVRSTELTRTAALVAVAGCAIFLVVVWLWIPWVGGDTPFVFDGSNALLNCLSAHDFSKCGYTGELNHWGLMTPIGYWPL